MNRNIKYLKIIGLAGFLYLWAVPATGKNNDKSVTINTNGSKFVIPLIEKWTEEYKKIRPDVTFNIVDKTETASLSVVISQPDEGEPDKTVAFAGRYVLLPIGHPENPIVKSSKGLNRKELKDILFEKDLLDDDGEPQKARYKVNVYTRVNNKNGADVVLAQYFNAKKNRIKGRKLYGDEVYILNAINKDATGIAYANLSYIFDLNTRRLKPELSLLPLNIKSRHKEKLYSEDADQVIRLLEEEEIDLIPVVRFGFETEKDHTGEAAGFVKWILTRGQEYNHAFGFLRLDETTLARQNGFLQNENRHVSLR
ncbi:MAG: hypothetical protein LBS03_08705 [Bacteroidales bacterium]|jgi:ABC-type phosphate transport system substrate-binding protein|nr:hypothetical protein [Bacteroidales bacterium]